MTFDPDERVPLSPGTHAEHSLVGPYPDTVELRARHDPVALVLDLLRTASAVTMAIALIVIAAALT